MNVRVIVCTGLLGGFLGLAPASYAQTITGTATYRERIALPANAVFEATLEDVSRADAPATVLGRVKLESPGQPPFRFSIPYTPAQIQSGRSYSVRARVTAGGDLMFTSDQSYPVLTRGAGKEVSIVMRRVSAPASSAQPRAEMNGMFRYMADAATFTDCQTGQRRPVAMEGAYKELEAAYLKMRQQPGQELKVSLEGSVADRPGADGGRPVPTLVVSRYIRFWPGETCGVAGATAPFRETNWKLTLLQGEPVILKSNAREPNLVFRTAGDRVTGYGGCNEFSGSYVLKGSDLSFGNLAMTLRACADGMDIEGRFTAALSVVRSWKILGEQLELYDSAGRMLARFEARASR